MDKKLTSSAKKKEFFKGKPPLKIPSSNPNRKNTPDNSIILDPQIFTKQKPPLSFTKRIKTEASYDDKILQELLNKLPVAPSLLQKHQKSMSVHEIQAKTPPKSPVIQSMAQLSPSNYSTIKPAQKQKPDALNIDELINSWKQLSSEKYDLEAQLAVIKKENDTLKVQLSAYEKEFSQMQEKGFNENVLISRENDLETKLFLAENEILRLQKMLNAKPTNTQRSEEEFRALEHQISLFQKDLQNATFSLQFLEKENSELRALQSRFQFSPSKHESKYKEDIEILVKEMLALRDRNLAFELENQNLQHLLQESEIKIRSSVTEHFPGELNSLRKENTEFKSDSAFPKINNEEKFQIEIERLQKENSIFAEEISKLRNKIIFFESATTENLKFV